MNPALTSFLLAAAAALLMGVAAVAQAVAARRVTGPSVVVHPWYLTGGALDVIGWGLSLLAMRHLPLLVVQTVLATSLAVTVLLARAVLGVRVSRGGAAAVVVLSGAVTLVSVAGQPGRPAAPPAWFTPALWAALAAVVLLSLAASRVRRVAPAAVAAGLGYAGAAIGGRAAHAADWQHLLLNPVAWAVVGFAVTGTLMFARALQASPDAVAPATAWLWLMEVVVPATVGVAVLGDRVRPGWGVPAFVAVLVAVAATLVLSRAVSIEDPPAAPQAAG